MDKTIPYDVFFSPTNFHSTKVLSYSSKNPLLPLIKSKKNHPKLNLTQQETSIKQSSTLYKLISDCHKQGGKSLSIFSLHCLFPHTIKVLTSFHLAFNSAATTFGLFLERLVKITPDFIKYLRTNCDKTGQRGVKETRQPRNFIFFHKLQLTKLKI